MASSETRRSKRVPIEPEESDSQSSQEPQVDIIRSAQNIVKNHKNRREATRQTLEGEHQKLVLDVKQKISNFYGVRKGCVTKSQSDLWKRLENLNKRREALETRILTSMKMIESTNGHVSAEMAAVIIGRIQGIKETASPQSTWAW